MEENNLEQLQEFVSACNDFADGKFILADIKISKILRLISKTPQLYDLIAECMINFDFREEWKKATASTVLKLPETDAKRISFIFCMLNNFDDKNLDVTNILERFFSYDSTCSAYDLFLKNIIAEFKRLVISNLNFGELAEEETQATNIDEFDVLSGLLKGFSAYILEKRKIKNCFMSMNDLVAVISTFEQVVQNRQVEYFYAFDQTINAAIIKNKDLRKRFADANKIIDDIIRRV